MMRPLTYWCSGGDLCARGAGLAVADALALRDLHLDEARAAVAAGSPDAASAALALANELGEALRAAGDWRAAAHGGRAAASRQHAGRIANG